jgi:2-C-methyl-D-erythritol 4-phosphate cytidylyltransferase/2-C-methyl-D-erythritol 2,4-cyclodiphosphate synthase
MIDSVILLAAGNGERAGGLLPKQFAQLGGECVWRVAYNNLRAALPNAKIIIVGNASHKHLWDLSGLAGDYEWVEGGVARFDSVRLGLCALQPYAPKNLLIHDAARPFVPKDLIIRLQNALSDGSKAAIPALPIYDTVKKISDNNSVIATLSRDELFTVQTPQAFDFQTLFQLHQKSNMVNITDDAMLFERAGLEVKSVVGDKMAFKITTMEDLELARYYHTKNQSPRLPKFKTAFGYDVHRLQDFDTNVPPSQQKIRLGGIDIAHSKHLLGHSDADVVLHAITDALLGLVASGDIGSHFPPSDARNKGLDSAIFLRHAMQLLLAGGGAVCNIDVTIICEAPKIAKFRDLMRARIAEIIKVDVQQISVKATTTEGLGFAGRGEGIAAQVIATAIFE